MSAHGRPWPTHRSLNWVWDTGTLTWVVMTQPTGGGGDATAANQVIGNASLASIDAKTPALGQQLAAASQPVVLTAAQLATLTPPAAITGFATAVKQDTGNTSLNSIDTKLTNPLPVSAASLPLPAGAATSALQTQPGVDIGDVTINNAAGASAVNIQDGGNSITVDNAGLANLDVALSTRTKPADQQHTIVDSGTLTAVTAITNPLPAGTNVIGHVITDTGSTTAVTGSVTVVPTTYFGKTLTYVPVNQGASGTTTLAVADATKKHKVVGMVLTMSLTGTLKLSDGVADLLGPCDVATTGGFVAPTSIIPYTETGAINRALTLTTTVGAARGVVVILTEA
jgi:hypothetical protein